MGKPYPEPEFQSTLPSQGATQWFCTMSLTLVFQSTLPSQGATRTTLTIQALIMVFQSTLPSQGATFPHLVNLFANVDFNPRSPHRERHRSYIYTLEKSNFNPRSPHRERHYYVSLRSALFLISIHAPLTGSDYCLCFLLVIYSLFQSTLPSQGATAIFSSPVVSFLFQSTLPSQGATKIVEDVTFSSDISIHAPLTGGDLGRLDRYIRYADISIHAPLTGSDFRFPARFMVFDISIHAPLTGSDIQWQLSGRCCGISIHAPLTGSDRAAMVSPETTSRFQSTLPSQGATIGKQKLQKALQFQSTLPSQGATGLETGEYIVKQISIHAPLTGSDGHEVQMVWRRSYFNPRSPHRERLNLIALLAFFWSFQSTLPSQGATRWWDPELECEILFQSTLPSQGATKLFPIV